MLWILFIGGCIGAISYLFYIVFLFFVFEWDEIGQYSIKLAICAVIGLVGLFGLVGIDSLEYKEVAQTDELELVSLTDNSEISGSASGGLFYVHASIDTDEVYSFYYEVDNGGIKRGKVSADDTIIYEKENCTPHVVEYTTYTKNKMNNTLRVILAFGYGKSSHKTYEIYTTPGTVLRTFALDTQ